MFLYTKMLKFVPHFIYVFRPSQKQLQLWFVLLQFGGLLKKLPKPMSNVDQGPGISCGFNDLRAERIRIVAQLPNPMQSLCKAQRHEFKRFKTVSYPIEVENVPAM